MSSIEQHNKRKARVIAFYLPQFHPIPENDEWWEKGFTEWTNVTKSTPLFSGHHQPNLPTELGFYDLRVAETREAQAKLAHEYGVEGFCYWHYWFGHGKQLLERPLKEVIALGKPELPFCLGWANETWSGILHGLKNRTLITQEYPGIDDYKAHFEAILPALTDERYICIDGKPVFLLYKPEQLPDSHQFISCWRELARASSMKGKDMYFIGVAGPKWDPLKAGFDGSVLNEPRPMIDRVPLSPLQAFCKNILKRDENFVARHLLSKPRVIEYATVAELEIPKFPFPNYPCVVPNWDTTPRMGKHAIVFNKSTPALFRKHLRKALAQIQDRDDDHKLLFLKSWNEWAEGNYVEPDRRYGREYLDVIRDEVVV